MTDPVIPAVVPKYRSGEELAMRALIVPELRKRWPGARIIHELPTRYSQNRIDLAAVTETEIVSVEIKSSRDTTARLEAQIRAFLPISTLLIVALAPRMNEKLPSLVTKRKDGPGESYEPRYTDAQQIIQNIGDSTIETWTVSASAGQIERTAGGYVVQRACWAGRMLDILHVAELKQIAGRHRLSCSARAAHAWLVSLCADYMTGRQVQRAVCRALRERDAFDAASDPPIRVKEDDGDAAPTAALIVAGQAAA